MKIRSKFILIFLLISLVPMLVLMQLFYRESQEVVKDLSLKSRLKLVNQKASQTQDFLDSYKNLTLLASDLPPITGIIRSKDTGVDMLDRSTIEQWKSRLKRLFVSFSETHPFLTQIRYIDENGNELVRADAKDGKITITPDDKLQNKSQRPYFIETAKRSTSEVYVSDIELNMEYGQIERPERPIIRFSVPVFDENRKFCGVVVTNVLVKGLFEELDLKANALLDDETELVLIDQSGEFLIYRDESMTFAKQRKITANYFIKNPGLAKEIHSLDTGIREDLKSARLNVWRNIFFDRPHSKRHWTLIIKTPFEALEKPIDEIRDRSSVLLLVLSANVVILALFLARLLGLPFVRLSLAAKEISRGNYESVIAKNLLKRQDEVGTFSREFDSMAQSLRKLRLNLESQVQERTKDLEQQRKAALNIMEDAREALKRAEAAEEELRLKALALEASNQELQQFSYVSSHDLQEPLRKIRTYGDLLVEDCGDALGEDGKRFIDVMQSSAARMQDLINALLIYSRVSKKEIELQPVDLNEVLADVITDLEIRIEESDANVIFPKNLPTVAGEPIQLRQLFQNLISNALKFMPEGQKPNIEISYHESVENFIEVRITDNGIGIEEQYARKIFAPFQRLHTRSEYAGTGIGLAICKKIIDRHGGKIWLESEKGKGSTFHFTLVRHGV